MQDRRRRLHGHSRCHDENQNKESDFALCQGGHEALDRAESDCVCWGCVVVSPRMRFPGGCQRRQSSSSRQPHPSIPVVPRVRQGTCRALEAPRAWVGWVGCYFTAADAATAPPAGWTCHVDEGVVCHQLESGCFRQKTARKVRVADDHVDSGRQVVEFAPHFASSHVDPILLESTPPAHLHAMSACAFSPPAVAAHAANRICRRRAEPAYAKAWARRTVVRAAERQRSNASPPRWTGCPTGRLRGPKGASSH